MLKYCSFFYLNHILIVLFLSNIYHLGSFNPPSHECLQKISAQSVQPFGRLCMIYFIEDLTFIGYKRTDRLTDKADRQASKINLQKDLLENFIADFCSYYYSVKLLQKNNLKENTRIRTNTAVKIQKQQNSDIFLFLLLKC